MLGTRGVPAHYGGFETAVEEVGRRLAARGHRVLVYSRNPDPSTPLPPLHLGMRVVELPALKRRSLETLSHTALSVGHLLRRVHPDVAIVFNSANAPFLPALRAQRMKYCLPSPSRDCPCRRDAGTLRGACRMPRQRSPAQ